MQSSTYLFKSDNFGFRPVNQADLKYLLLLDTDPETMHFFPTGAQTPEDVEIKIQRYISDFEKNGYGIFLVFNVDSGEFIGRAGFGDITNHEIEVGYLILKKYWGKGYATRILKILLAWAKENIKRDKVIAYTPVDHVASEKVMLKAGMVFTKTAEMKDTTCVVYEYKL